MLGLPAPRPRSVTRGAWRVGEKLDLEISKSFRPGEGQQLGGRGSPPFSDIKLPAIRTLFCYFSFLIFRLFYYYYFFPPSSLPFPQKPALGAEGCGGDGSGDFRAPSIPPGGPPRSLPAPAGRQRLHPGAEAALGRAVPGRAKGGPSAEGREEGLALCWGHPPLGTAPIPPSPPPGMPNVNSFPYPRRILQRKKGRMNAAGAADGKRGKLPGRRGD